MSDVLCAKSVSDDGSVGKLPDLNHEIILNVINVMPKARGQPRRL